MTGKEPRLSLLAIGLIVIFSFLLRFENLDRVPPGLWFDEALNGIDAWSVWQPGGGFRLIYPDVFPREPMFETLLALAVRVGGAEIVVLRTVSAVIGTLTILFLYLMLRKEAGEGVALTAAGVLAGMRWHVLFSKLIFRTLMLPLWMILIVWCALEYRRRPTLWKAALLGALMGGGFYTYLAWYFMLPSVVGVVVWALVRAGKESPGSQFACDHESGRDIEKEKEKRKRVAGAALAMACAVAIVAPLGIHYLYHPQDLLARPGAVSVFSAGWAGGAGEILENAGEAILMLHWRGDHVPVQNIPHAAGLDLIQGIFFIWGMVMLLRRRNHLSWILLGWIACGLATTIFTNTDSPNFLRSLVITPAVAALVAYGLVDGAHRLPVRGRGAAIIGVLLFSAAVSAWRIERWHLRPDVRAKYQTMVVEMGRVARELSDADASVLVYEPIHSALPFRFQVLGRNNIYPYNEAGFEFMFQRPWPVVSAAVGRERPRLRHIIVPAGAEAESRARRLAPQVLRTRTWRDESTGGQFTVLTIEESSLGRRVGDL